jgi:transcriptional regulator with XRE-family HTH domain
MRKSVKIKASPHLLKKLRENSGYTEEELANKLGVTAEKIVKVEKGEDSFTLTQVKKLADIYKVPLAAFFSKEVPDVPSLPDYRINREKKLNPEVFVAIRRAKYLSEEVRELSGKKSEIPSFPDSSPEEVVDRGFWYKRAKVKIK